MVDTNPADSPAIVSMEAGPRPCRLEVVMGSDEEGSEDAVTTVSGCAQVENHVEVGGRLMIRGRAFHLFLNAASLSSTLMQQK